MTWDMSAAPDYAPGWPSGGERIGPAWVDVWAYLQDSDPQWRTAAEVASMPTVARHDLAPRTITNMLTMARRAHLLDVRYAKCGDPRVKRARYRIAP